MAFHAAQDSAWDNEREKQDFFMSRVPGIKDLNVLDELLGKQNNIRSTLERFQLQSS
jgi:hypothetical protein